MVEGLISEQWIITGRVQGVGYRYYTLEHARTLNLTGTVCNCADGSVKVTVTGNKSQIEQLFSCCQKGPFYAKVEEIQRIQLKRIDFHKIFSITY